MATTSTMRQLSISASGNTSCKLGLMIGSRHLALGPSADGAAVNVNDTQGSVQLYEISGISLSLSSDVPPKLFRKRAS
jgi:hypothetical protein